MKLLSQWSAVLPNTSAELARCMSISGSLTEYLVNTGHRFSVEVLAQGVMPAHADEAAVFQITTNAALYARHVCLKLDDTPVVVARSSCLTDCQIWLPVLDRGSRSLGLTLFGGLPGLQRSALQFACIDNTHPLQLAAQQHDRQPALSYPARRCHFELNRQGMLVCETFLPALETFL